MTITDSFQKRKENTAITMIRIDSGNPAESGKVPYHPKTSRLLKAVEEKSEDGVRQYLDEGVPVNGSGGAFNETPLHKAAQLAWKDGMRLLLDEGADVYAKNDYDQLPLHYACASKSCKCVRLLLDDRWQTTFNQKDIRGHTPLHDASTNGCVKCVGLLLKGGAAVDVKDINDETPLHKAAKVGSVATMLTLLNNGADLIAKDKAAESALSYITRFMPGGIDMLLDHCLQTNSKKMTFKKLQVSFNFIPVAGGSEKNQVKNLRNLVDLGHQKLLLHPLCESYLLLKWNNIRRYFFFEVIFYFIYAILASVIILDKFVPAHGRGYRDVSGFRIVFVVIVVIQTVLILLKECLMMTQGIWKWLQTMWHVRNMGLSVAMLVVLLSNWSIVTHHLASVVILLLWVECMLHISRFPTCGIYIAMFTKVAKVFLQIFSIFFCLLIAFSLSFLVSRYRCDERYTRGCIMLEEDDSFNPINIPESLVNSTETIINSTSAQMIANTNYTSINITVTSSPTTEPYAEDGTPIIPAGWKHRNNLVYSSIPLSFYKTVTMMIGELNFDDELIRDFDIQIGTSHVIYFAFVFMVSIILSNLLVALAVNDVQGLRNSAYLARVIKQMELVLQMEKTFDTLEATAKFLRLEKFSKRNKTLMQDLVACRISIEPHHPTKGTRMMIIDKGQTREVDIKKGLVAKILDCLKQREDFPSVGDNTKMTVRRHHARSVVGDPGETRELLKSLESFVIELSSQMNNLTELCNSMNSRLQSVESAFAPKMGTSARGTVSSPLDNSSMSSLDHSTVSFSPNISQIGCLNNTNDAPV